MIHRWIRRWRESDYRPIAEQAVESLKETVASLQRAVATIERLHAQLDDARAEIFANRCGSMEEAAQVSELEHLFALPDPRSEVEKNV